jgi:hypothetical protein
MRSTFINIALLLGSIVVSLFMFEGALRVKAAFKPCHALGSIPNPLVWHLRPANQDLHLRCEEYDTIYRTNSSGFRGPEFPSMEKSDDTARVVFLGDSFVEAIEVEEDERFPRLVDTELGEKTDAVILGYAGSSPVHALAYYRHIGGLYSPDVVVHAFYSVNDIIEHDDDFSQSESGTIQVQPHPHENWRLRLGRNSLLVQLVYDRVYRPIRLGFIEEEEASIREISGPFFNFTKDGYNDLETKGAWQYTKSIMQTLQAEVEADGAQLVIIMIPPFFLVHEERKIELEELFSGYLPLEDLDYTSTYDRLVEELRSTNILVVDPIEALQLAYANGERIYLPKDPHVTEVGHRILADELLPALRSLRILDL